MRGLHALFQFVSAKAAVANRGKIVRTETTDTQRVSSAGCSGCVAAVPGWLHLLCVLGMSAQTLECSTLETGWRGLVFLCMVYLETREGVARG